jgi:drug/metabolite transporter (DMT)-like permease
LFGKIALAELTVPHMILYRLMFACGGFLPVALARGFVHRREDWITLSMAAAFGVPCVFLIQFEGLARTTVAHASLMVGTSPILLGSAAALVGRERVDKRRYALLATSTLGALPILVSGNGATKSPRAPTALEDALVLVSLLALAGWVLASKRLMQRYDPSTLTASVMIVGTIFLSIVVLAFNGLPPVRVTFRAWMALAAQGTARHHGRNAALELGRLSCADVAGRHLSQL